MNYNIVETQDGSHTLMLLNKNESYHSIYGALSESMHIYIERGLHCLKNYDKINVLEIGFGTGLNALLTHKEKTTSQSLFYHAIEPYPIEMEDVRKLNYAQILGVDKTEFEKMHQCKAGLALFLNNHFSFLKDYIKVEDAIFNSEFYNLIYFDQFNPELDFTPWEQFVFEKLYKAAAPGCLLLTYCAKGQVRRHMKAAGFRIEKLAGPKMKREITRAIK